MRRALSVLLVFPLAWLLILVSGYGKLTGRQVQTSAAREAQVTCLYWHALGTYETNAFTPTPDAIVCPRYAAVHWPATLPPIVKETQWAQTIPTDQPALIDCMFVRLPEGALEPGNRYNFDAPLHLSVDLRREITTFVDKRDADDFGPPKLEGPTGSQKRIVWQRFEEGRLAVFRKEHSGKVWLIVHPDTGVAEMMVLAKGGSVRHGGCHRV